MGCSLSRMLSCSREGQTAAKPPPPSASMHSSPPHPLVHSGAHTLALSPAAAAPCSHNVCQACGRRRGTWPSASPKTSPWGGVAPCLPPGCIPGLGGGMAQQWGCSTLVCPPPLHTHPLHVQRHPSTHLSTHAFTMHSPPPSMHSPLHQPPHVHSLILSLYVGSPALWL